MFETNSRPLEIETPEINILDSNYRFCLFTLIEITSGSRVLRWWIGSENEARFTNSFKGW